MQISGCILVGRLVRSTSEMAPLVIDWPPPPYNGYRSTGGPAKNDCVCVCVCIMLPAVVASLCSHPFAHSFISMVASKIIYILDLITV